MKLYQEVTANAQYPLHTYWMSSDRGSIGGYIPVGGTFTVFSKPMTFAARGRKFVEAAAPVMSRSVVAEVQRMEALLRPRTVAPVASMVTKTVAGSGGVVYTLTRGGGGWRCTCPGYTYRGRCKHSQTETV